MNNKTLETLCKNYNSDRDYNGNYGHYLAEQVFRQKENEELEQRAEFENYFSFVNAVNKLRINLENKFADRYEKEKLIKKYTNYTKLNGSGSRKEFLKDCSDRKIGSAFKNIYLSALNKIKEYEIEEKNEK